MAMDGDKTMRIAAMADLHYGRGTREELATLLGEASDAADVLLLCGDLSDHGRTAEAKMIVEDIRANVRANVLAVMGNHDHATDNHEEFVGTLQDGGINVLDGDCAAIGNVGFAGVRGFCGGFGKRAVHPFGEPELREFINVTVEEALKLETALSQMGTEHKVVLLHYAPIRATVEGEPPEIFPFLGASRLEDPINHYEASVVFHGHAHRGAPSGKTQYDIPVFNVSLPVLKREYPSQPAYRLYEIELSGESVS